MSDFLKRVQDSLEKGEPDKSVVNELNEIDKAADKVDTSATNLEKLEEKYESRSLENMTEEEKEAIDKHMESLRKEDSMLSDAADIMNVHTALVKLTMEVETKTEEIKSLIEKFRENHGDDKYQEIFKDFIG